MKRWIYLGKVWLLAAAIRLGLWMLPFATLQRLVTRWGRRASGRERPLRPETLALAVLHAVRFLPGANCLTRALTTQVLLARAGHASRIRFGVRQGPRGNLLAHAWVESSGKVLMGGGDLALFVELPLGDRS